MLLGAIIGDIAGSSYEGGGGKPADFAFFPKGSSITDDSVMTLAVAKAVVECAKNNDWENSKKYYLEYTRTYGSRYPHAGYGHGFKEWLQSDNPKPYGSYGNGSAMRVSAIGYAFDGMDRTLAEAEKSAAITHNHPDGIRGAKAVAAAVHLARNGRTREEIGSFIESDIGYPLDFNLDRLHADYRFEIQCSQSVPQALFAFLVSNDFEDAVRKALWIGGDTDTIACIAGAVAEAFYKTIPGEIKSKAMFYLDADQKKVVREFNGMFGGAALG
jgi:ADP-ribosylglycohydrolase